MRGKVVVRRMFLISSCLTQKLTERIALEILEDEHPKWAKKISMTPIVTPERTWRCSYYITTPQLDHREYGSLLMAKLVRFPLFSITHRVLTFDNLTG